MPVRVRPRAVPGLLHRSDEVPPYVSVRNRHGPGGPRRAIDKSISGIYGSGRSMIAIPKAFPPPGCIAENTIRRPSADHTG